METHGKTPHPPASLAPSRRTGIGHQRRLQSAAATGNDAGSNSRPPVVPPLATASTPQQWSLLEHLRVRSGGDRPRWQNREAAELLRKLREDPHAFVHARAHDGGRGLRASASASARARASTSGTAAASGGCNNGSGGVLVLAKTAGAPTCANAASAATADAAAAAAAADEGDGVAALDADDPYDLELLLAGGGGFRCGCVC